MSGIITLDIVLAGGKGTGLYPLTTDRTKPAVPIGARWRVIDAVLNNINNSGGQHVYLLVEYKPDSLIKHVNNAWNQNGIQVHIKKSTHKYDGTADAVYQNRGLVQKINPDVVNVFGGDHIYLMDVSQMNKFHLDNKADLTIAVIPLRLEEAAGKFGVLEVNQKGQVMGFKEKPEHPTPMPTNPEFCLASMGIYNFNPRQLVKYLRNDAKKAKPEGNNGEIAELVADNPNIYSLHDFGHNIIPAMVNGGRRVYAYNFATNRIIGAPAQPYWRDIGKLIDFYNANRDMMGVNPAIRFDLPNWPMRTFKEAETKPDVNPTARVLESLLAEGVVIGEKSLVEESSLSYNVKIGERAVIFQSIVLGHATVGKRTKLNRTILDRGANTPEDIEIGFNEDEDRARKFTIVPGGITVVPRNYQFK